MERIPSNDFLEFNPNSLQYLRELYNLQNPLRLKEAINILEDWIKKQEHFVKKQYPRDYLERGIILGKGSIEKVKNKLDVLSTYRTLLPTYFEMFDPEPLKETDMLLDTLLPKMTEDHYRVYILKVTQKDGEKIPSDNMNFYRCFIALCEYIHTYDYCNGVVMILDYTEANVIDIAKTLDILQVHQVIKILVEGYGLRLKGIHIVTPSKLANVIVAFFKQATSEKIGRRIFLHKTFDTLYESIPKDILPADLNGHQKSLKQMHIDMINSLSSEEFSAHLDEMRGACTNENFRQKDKFNHDFMGTPGSFRSLCLD
ncbi:alpha-tocopherol transfer protein-like [Aricia agestis]|uniref:alpha-tocopherol transfer protein-like n=1 Tax=Aricia agestis TaxID=91739 RepID=UPI001C20C10A|nr:alpha-tocopherol transfer protein-like [Aricia agestis]